MHTVETKVETCSTVSLVAWKIVSTGPYDVSRKATYTIEEDYQLPCVQYTNTHRFQQRNTHEYNCITAAGFQKSGTHGAQYAKKR